MGILYDLWDIGPHWYNVSKVLKDKYASHYLQSEKLAHCPFKCRTFTALKMSNYEQKLKRDLFDVGIPCTEQLIGDHCTTVGR